MKKIIFILSLSLMFGSVHFHKVDAQVIVNINIDVQPAWGPSGYDYAEYYYIPEINIYYDVVHRVYYYPSGARWIRAAYLPSSFRYYDFYSLYKVVLNGILQPWRYNANHLHLYAQYRHNYLQVPIFYMTDYRYLRARMNYFQWVEARYMPHNEGRPPTRNFAANQPNGRISTPNQPARSGSSYNRNTQQRQDYPSNVQRGNAPARSNATVQPNNGSTTRNNSTVQPNSGSATRNNSAVQPNNSNATRNGSTVQQSNRSTVTPPRNNSSNSNVSPARNTTTRSGATGSSGSSNTSRSSNNTTSGSSQSSRSSTRR